MSGEPLVSTPGKCPYCNYPVPSGSPPLCLNCLRPLPSAGKDEEQMAENAVTPSGLEPPVTDGSGTASTTEPIPVAAPENGPAMRICPACQFENAMTRARCERCAEELVPQPRVPAPPPPPSGSLEPRSSRRPWVMVGAVLGAALLVFGLTYLLASRDGTKVPGSGASSPAATAASSSAPPVPTRVPRKAITAAASSTLGKGGRYSINNTLDGKRGTAWNSDGSAVGPQAKGVRLTYRFDRPRELKRIDIYNGYQKSDEVFVLNGRLRRVRLIADDGRTQILELEDKQGRQSFKVKLGATAKVVLEVEKVWREGARLDDLALSDIAFYAGG